MITVNGAVLYIGVGGSANIDRRVDRLTQGDRHGGELDGEKRN